VDPKGFEPLTYAV